jgi:hypothetical protein
MSKYIMSYKIVPFMGEQRRLEFSFDWKFFRLPGNSSTKQESILISVEVPVASRLPFRIAAHRGKSREWNVLNAKVGPLLNLVTVKTVHGGGSSAASPTRHASALTSLYLLHYSPSHSPLGQKK